LKEYWSVEINTCNRYREKCTELEKNYGKALQKIAELDKENTELSKKL
jgi:prefoldin subunit 5